MSAVSVYGAMRALVATSAALLVLCAAPVVAQTESDDLDLECGPPPPGHPIKGRRDYRLGDVNPDYQRDFRYHDMFHIRPAAAQLRAGQNLNINVMNNLHFVLHKVPNSEPALRLLIEWDMAGGRQADYSPPKCYFAWARLFAPDDLVVWNYGGYYFQRKGDTRRAIQWWNRALELDPANPEVNYSLGLIDFEAGDFDGARQHAWIAYAGGYPLSGLREKLQAAGQWRDPPRNTGAKAQ